MNESDDIFPGDSPQPEGEEFDCALESFVARSAQATTWRVESILKASDFETTELVCGAPGSGPAGRYVRKRIDAASGAGSAYRALWEAQRAGACPDCVPRLIELGVMDDELTVVMEYIDGVTVVDLVRALGAGVPVVEMVMPGLCEAVARLHDGFDPPLIHRDLKPSNVLMRDGEPVIIDFGSARQWREGADADTAHFLTRCYAPPEQFGFGQTDARSDVYALGKMVFYCTTGRNPPNVCDAAACEGAGMPRAIAEVVARACAFDPKGRYGSAHELGEAIAGAVRAARAGEPAVPGGVTEVAGAAGSFEPAAPGGAVGPGRSARLGGAMRGGVLPRVASMAVTVWNIAWLSAYAVLVVGALFAIVNPNVRDMPLPLWFRVLEYGGVAMVAPGALVYLLLAKRRLRERIPALAKVGRVREVVIALAIACAGVAVPLIAGSISGLI